MKHLWIGSLALGCCVLAGCASRREPLSGTVENLPGQGFRREWAADLELPWNDEVERVFVNEDLVFVYSKKNLVFAVQRNSGRIRFSARLPDSPVRPHPPVVLKERIVFPMASTLEIYRRSDGQFERSYQTQLSLRTDAVGSPGGTRLFYGADHPSGGRLVAIETQPGQYKPVTQRWELMNEKSAGLDSAPAVATGVVYVAFEDGSVYAVNADNRAPIWATSTGLTFQTYGPVQADLRVDDFGLYVPSVDTKFYCLDRTQGKIKWQYYAGTSLRDDFEVTATTVYLPLRGRGIVAIDKQNGPAAREPKWIQRDCVKLVSEDEKFSYFQRMDNLIVAVDKQTGEQKFTSQRRDLASFATNTRDGMIFAASKRGRLYAIAPVLKPGSVGEVAAAPGNEATGLLASR